MLHRHDFAAAARGPMPPRRPDSEPLSPGRYLRLRRVAAGLSERDLAQRMAAVWMHGVAQHVGAENAPQPRTRVTIRDLIDQMLIIVRGLELPSAVARRRDTIDAISLVLSIDPDVYWQLADSAPSRHPRICRGCGASTHDAGEPVNWSTASCCTACADAGGNQ